MANERPTEKKVEFPEVPLDRWKALVEEDPRNLPFEKRLTTELEDGIRIQPLYAGRAQGEEGLPGSAPWIRGAERAPDPEGWDVRQVVDLPEVREAGRLAGTEVERGATSLRIRLGRGGIPLERSALEEVLSRVPLERFPISLDAGADFVQGAELLREVWAARGVGEADALGAFDADPLGTLAGEGSLRGSLEESLGQMASLALLAKERLPLVTAALVSTAPYHDAGATAAQELGAALSTACLYLRSLAEAGLGVDEASGQVVLELQVGPDVFLEMAKLRAARWTWGRVLAASGAKEPRIRIQARTAWRMMTRRDPWVNLLRTTTAAFAAGAGGARGVVVLPFDAPLGLPEELGRRLGRNVQRLLIDETRLHLVTDPAGGSHYVERLTEEIAEKGWEQFQALEREGGIARALLEGRLHGAIAREAEKREEKVARRALPITGVSEFPNLREEPLERRGRELQSGAHGGVSVEPLPRRRLSLPFDRLRDRSDACLAQRGRRPFVFLANLGPVAEHNARATWIANLLASGGIEAISNHGFSSGSEAAEAFRSSGATVAVICGSDATYDTLAPEAASSLKQAGASRVLLAGRPGEREASWREAGVDGFLHLGQDVPETLGALLDLLGAPKEVAR